MYEQPCKDSIGQPFKSLRSALGIGGSTPRSRPTAQVTDDINNTPTPDRMICSILHDPSRHKHLILISATRKRTLIFPARRAVKNLRYDYL